MARLTICTIVNDFHAYARMKASFERAGFDEERCRFVSWDNSSSNQFEPAHVFNQLLASTAEPFAVFCHQDVLLDQGHGYERLQEVIEELERTDPSWAIAGNAGGTETLRLALRITDPTAAWNVGNFPRRVFSLDENFLLVKVNSMVRCSAALKGFHLYGADLCLNPWQRGRTSYVVDFHLRHLSDGGGNGKNSLEVQRRGAQEFARSRQLLQEIWNPRVVFRYVCTPATVFLLSRFGLVRTVFGGPGAIATARRLPRLHGAYCRLIDNLFGRLV